MSKHENNGFFAPYTLPLLGLKKGQHTFEFHLDDAFLAHFEHSPIEKANVEVRLELDKNKDTFFVLNFSLYGTVNVECDRCLADFDRPVESENEVVLKLSQLANEVDGDADADVVYLTPDTTQFNVAQLLYEFLVLSVPLPTSIPLDAFGNRQCPRDENGNFVCNEKVLATLQQNSAFADEEELEEEPEEEDEDNTEDPRWNALRNIRPNGEDNL